MSSELEKDMAEQLERWEAELHDPLVSKRPLRRSRFQTSSGEEIPSLSLPASSEGSDESSYLDKLGFPGAYPYTRGVQPTMYRGRLWTMRQYAGFGTAEESNARYRYLLDQGQTGLSVAFDLPTQMGYDSDAEAAIGEVGRVGVAIDSVEDMASLLDRIPLGQVSTSMTINATAPVLLSLYVAVGKKQGVASKDLRGTVQNDILKEYIARGTWIYPPRPSMRLVTDIFAYCAREVPQWNTISISGYHVREAGCTAAQEVAFTLANGIAYVDAARQRGLAVDDFAPRLSFFFNCHNNFLEEVAKFRAARRLWARLMRERFGAKNPKSMKLRFHTQTAGSTLTAQQPDNNIVRVALQALAAVLGGTQSLHTNSRDEALALPTEEAVRIALRTQQIIASESGVADATDPLAGSYHVEWLTDALEASAVDYIDRIDAMGGMVSAIEQGFVQREIQDAAYRTQRAIESGESEVVGVNTHRLEDESPTVTMSIDPELEEQQVARLQDLRSRRDSAAAQAAIDALKRAAEGDDNLLPHVLHAVESLCSLGEISDALRDVFGLHREVVVL
ncbi:MAG: methylmalonyl-CoA mutase family protein [Myxococcota bacterium]|nr:methylmalonyl-CoA mutase family protein [Myxococcota bacterium]